MTESYLPRTFKLSLATGAEQELFVQGSFFYCIACSATEFEVAVDNVATGFFAAGMGYRIPPGSIKFEKLRIRNISGGTMTLTLVAGDGDIEDNRLNIISDVTTMEAIPDNLTTLEDVSIPNSAGHSWE